MESLIFGIKTRDYIIYSFTYINPNGFTCTKYIEYGNN